MKATTPPPSVNDTPSGVHLKKEDAGVEWVPEWYPHGEQNIPHDCMKCDPTTDPTGLTQGDLAALA